jgi:hypothetical protein
MGHQHLVLAYSLTWLMHGGYLAYVLRKWMATRS